jgi:hypothetical protein
VLILYYFRNKEVRNVMPSLCQTLPKRISVVLALAIPLLVSGCSSEPEGPAMFKVVGAVSFDGAPVADGRIQFRKADGDQKAFSGEIKDGKYSLEAEAGKMAVEITASRPSGKFDNSNPDDPPQPIGEMYIPAKYNTETTLSAEVTPAAENNFPFDIVSK